MIERDGNQSGKQENTSDHNGNSKQTTSWSRFKDPRVVRVSRAFGGKDRHSKVCTVRGLRDRRVRLSVPTAIQLYDLQDRLGLNQPSKVVDWLLNVAKHEIDGLPPLQFPILTPNHGFFIPAQSPKQGLKISADFNWNDPSKTKPSTSGRVFPGDGNDDHDPYNQHNPSSFSSLLSGAPFNSWDPPNLTLSQPPAQDLDNFTLASHHPHLLLYQPGQPYFPGFDPKQPGFHGLELSNSSSVQPVRPFRFNINGVNDKNEHEELHSS